MNPNIEAAIVGALLVAVLAAVGYFARQIINLKVDVGAIKEQIAGVSATIHTLSSTLEWMKKPAEEPARFRGRNGHL